MYRKIGVAVGAVFLVLLLWLLPDRVVDGVQSALRELFLPFLSARRHLSQFWEFPSVAETARLREQAARLAAENRRLQLLEEENRELRQALGVAGRLPPRWLAAQVLARNVNCWWQTARIDRGARHDVAVGMPVLSVGGLVGRITAVSAHAADVLFIIDPACRVAAVIPRVNAFGIVRGEGVDWRGMAGCRMDFLAQETAITVGDEVLTAGLGGVFPAGLLIGYVRRVQADKSGLYKVAEIMPAVDFRALKFVFVIMPGEADEEDSGE